VLPHIFDPFYTTKNAGTASAFRLPIPSWSPTADLEVSSEPGRGASSASICRDARLVKSKARKRQMPFDAHFDYWCSKMNRVSARRWWPKLVRLDTSPAAAEGGQATGELSRALEEGRPFDVAILDLTIAGGWEAARRGRNARPDPSLKAIATSGYANDPSWLTSSYTASRPPSQALSHGRARGAIQNACRRTETSPRTSRAGGVVRLSS